MLGAKNGVIDNDRTKDQEAEPDSDLVGHGGPKRKCPPR